MLTGAKQWGPLPVLETGREDTSDCQQRQCPDLCQGEGTPTTDRSTETVSRSAVTQVSKHLLVYRLLVLVGWGTDSSHMWRSEDRQLVGGHAFYHVCAEV